VSAIVRARVWNRVASIYFAMQIVFADGLLFWSALIGLQWSLPAQLVLLAAGMRWVGSFGWLTQVRGQRRASERTSERTNGRRVCDAVVSWKAIICPDRLGTSTTERNITPSVPAFFPQIFSAWLAQMRRREGSSSDEVAASANQEGSNVIGGKTLLMLMVGAPAVLMLMASTHAITHRRVAVSPLGAPQPLVAFCPARCALSSVLPSALPALPCVQCPALCSPRGALYYTAAVAYVGPLVQRSTRRHPHTRPRTTLRQAPD
jgi:hypothetical protein